VGNMIDSLRWQGSVYLIKKHPGQQEDWPGWNQEGDSI